MMQKRVLYGLVAFNTVIAVGRGLHNIRPREIKIAAEVERNSCLVDDKENVIEKVPVRRTTIYCNEEYFNCMFNGLGVFQLSGKKGLEYKVTVKDVSTMTVMVTTRNFLGRKVTYAQIVKPKGKYATDEEIFSTIEDVRNWQRENVSFFYRSLI